MKIATLALCVLATLIWGAIFLATMFSGSDPATRDLDTGAGIIVTLLYGMTAVPSAFLVFKRRAPRLALILAISFPLVFLLFFAAAALLFA